MKTISKIYIFLSSIALVYLIYKVEFQNKDKFIMPMDLTVNSLKVIDRNSNSPVMIIADSVPDAIIGGKTLPREFKASGMLYFDSFGNEVGGLVVNNQDGENGLESTYFTFDYNNTDAFSINKNETPDAYSFGMAISDRNTVEEFKSNGTRGIKRIAFGVSGTNEKSQAGITINDNMGNQRIVLFVDDDNNVKILIFDENGKVLKDLAK